MDPDFLKDAVYFIMGETGDNGISFAACTFGDDNCFDYPANIKDAATDCGLNPLIVNEAGGLAINFSRVESIREFCDRRKRYGGPFVSESDFQKPPFNKLKRLDFTDERPTDGFSVIVFKNLFYLIVPFPPADIHLLKKGGLWIEYERRPAAISPTPPKLPPPTP